MLDAKRFIENLEAVPEKENQILERGKMLKTLLLVLAGDQRVIQSLSLEDIEDLFLNAYDLMDCFEKGMRHVLVESRLENYKGTMRRPV